jgi:hypothetical protein
MRGLSGWRRRSIALVTPGSENRRQAVASHSDSPSRVKRSNRLTVAKKVPWMESPHPKRKSSGVSNDESYLAHRTRAPSCAATAPPSHGGIARSAAPQRAPPVSLGSSTPPANRSPILDGVRSTHQDRRPIRTCGNFKFPMMRRRSRAPQSAAAGSSAAAQERAGFPFEPSKVRNRWSLVRRGVALLRPKLAILGTTKTDNCSQLHRRLRGESL